MTHLYNIPKKTIWMYRASFWQTSIVFISLATVHLTKRQKYVAMATNKQFAVQC